MKKLWWFIPILIALLTTLVSSPAQAGLIQTKTLPTLTEMSGTGMDIAQKITGDILQLDIKFTANNIAYFGLELKFNPSDYELEKVLAGNVLQNSGGNLAIVSPLKDSSPGAVVTLRKKSANWGEIRPGSLHISTKGKSVQAFEAMTPFVPNPSTSPKDLVLMNNYPNPFNPSTEIRYSLPTDGPVELVIYNMVGQVVRTLVNENMSAGDHTIKWNATDDIGDPVAGGIYFYKIKSGSQTATRRMLLLK